MANADEQLFSDYYESWIKIYKEGAVRSVTYRKYLMAANWIKKLMPETRLCDLNRISYQQFLNKYAETHEKQTVCDLNHVIKASILDAKDEGLVKTDPTRKIIIKGKMEKEKKVKFLNQFELHNLIESLNLGQKLNEDWLIYLIAKTGLRYSEALGLTPKDFDFSNQTILINKTWDYKEGGGFAPTKNKSSVRKVQIDWKMVMQFSELIKGLKEDTPIFLTREKMYNSTANEALKRHCKKLNIPVISIHGLRHTHASLLLFNGVSIASVAKRLGHANMTTTQKTYLHIIKELENKDTDIVMRAMANV